MEMISSEICILSVREGGQNYSMPVKGKKAVNLMQTSINDVIVEKAHNFRLKLVRKILSFNDFYFDDVELI